LSCGETGAKHFRLYVQGEPYIAIYLLDVPDDGPTQSLILIEELIFSALDFRTGSAYYEVMHGRDGLL
jgi:hypothetical protein